MSARIIDSNGNVEELSDREFFARLFGHPPMTPEQRAQHHRDRDAWIDRYKADTKRELAELQECIGATREVLREQRERDMAALKALPPLKFEVVSLKRNRRAA
jgi:hypothetical protein